jgi:hypothetical protein
VLIAQVERSEVDINRSLAFSKGIEEFLYHLNQSHDITINLTNKSMDNFLYGEGERVEGQGEANFEKKIFKVYKFTCKKVDGALNAQEIHNQDEDLPMNEKVLYSLKDLILLNQGKNRLMYFEIIEEQKSMSNFNSDTQAQTNKYTQKVQDAHI